MLHAPPLGYLAPPVALPHASGWFGTRHAAQLTSSTTFQPLATMQQVHGATVSVATGAGVSPASDALISNTPHLWLSVATADCTPVLISSPGAVAAVHLGWRSTQQNLLAHTIAALQQQFHQAPSQLHLCLGPSLSQACFEVEDSFPALFNQPNQAPFFAPGRAGHVHMNLPAIIRAQALAAGVPPGHIHHLALCTFSQPTQFHSYRFSQQSGQTAGRQYSLISFQPH